MALLTAKRLSSQLACLNAQLTIGCSCGMHSFVSLEVIEKYVRVPANCLNCSFCCSITLMVVWNTFLEYCPQS